MIKDMFKKLRKTPERGQAIILVAAAIVGLVAIVGLMVDGGIMLIEYARIKRAIDAASIGAASQFRKGFVGEDMERAGLEFLQFNGVNVTADNISIFTCEYPDTDHDLSLCSPTGQPKRKLVRISAERYVQFGFMRVLGINGAWISATSIGEAASIDMVLAIDTSSSMAYETTTEIVGGVVPDDNRSDWAVPGAGGHAGDDPIACNNNPLRRCEPMGTVKDVAVDFVDELFFPYDRVAVVAFTGQETDGSAKRNPVLTQGFSDVQADVEGAIRALRVFQPATCPQTLGPCLNFDPGYYQGQRCDPYEVSPFDPTSCGASNIGEGLYLAGDQFAGARQDSFWAVIALIGGPANAAVNNDNPLGICPSSTWDIGHAGFCRDLDPMPPTYVEPVVNDWTPGSTDLIDFRTYTSGFDWSTYYDTTIPTRHSKTDPEYDADDYARDGADYITSPTIGQNASLYAICLGQYCRSYPNTDDPASAELLGRYMAYEAGGDTANHGLYFQSNDAADLAQIFQSIADNIFTRISK